jgi:hypothetical protein
MNRIALAFIVILTCGPRAGATDIAFYVGAPNPDGWYDVGTQFQDVGTIIAKTGHLFHDIRQFGDDQFGDFGAWMNENTDDGEMDILWLNGCMPSVLYPYPNLQPDGSRIEKWLDGGNMVINVGDWFGYVSFEGGWWHGANLDMGAANILDLPPGVIAYADNTLLKVTPTGREYLPSLTDPVITYRPIVLSMVQPPWEVAAIFASGGGTDDPRAEQRADPVVIHNTATGAYVAFINQTGGGPANWIDRGQVCAEFIANWVMSQAQKPSPAWDPQPADGAEVDIDTLRALFWSVGAGAVRHDVYLGTDKSLVETADRTSALYRGRLSSPSFPLAGLVELGGHYFWRIDEVEADGVTIHKGPVWDFTVSPGFPIDDFENYTDEVGRRIDDVWIDGSLNGTGAQVGNPLPPFAEQTIVHGGKQSMPLSYNNAWWPYYSETTREFADPQDWTAGGMDTLSLWVRGQAAAFLETPLGTFTLSAAGADIWSAQDEFRYAYKRLDGDGAMVAQVHSLLWTDVWAKAGVMIRASLDPASAHAFMLVTPDGRRAFQNRPLDWSSDCFSAHGSPGAVTWPYWVKIERKGNQFAGYYSSDGVNWILQSAAENTGADASPNPQTIDMPASVFIGLALTSHASGSTTTATFSAVQAAGDVTGPWQVADIGTDHPGNSPADLYVTVADSAGNMAVVVNPDSGVVTSLAWTEWKIPLSRFEGVNLSQIERMSLGIGSCTTPTPDGSGRLYIDDIMLSNRPAPSTFGIYLVETGELLFSDQDMEAYVRATHTIEFHASGIDKWNSYLASCIVSDPPTRSLRKGLYEKEFAVRIDDKEYYRGKFWSAVSSVSCAGVVILDAALPCNDIRNSIHIDYGYPAPMTNNTDDPRNNQEIFDFFAGQGKLK